MVQITKSEVKLLTDRGYKFGDMIHRSYSRNPKYYATENKKILNILNKYRQSIIAK